MAFESLDTKEDVCRINLNSLLTLYNMKAPFLNPKTIKLEYLYTTPTKLNVCNLMELRELDNVITWI